MAEPKAKAPPKEKKPNRPPSWPGALSKAKVQAVCLSAVVGLDAALATANNLTAGTFWQAGTPPLGDRLEVQEAVGLASALSEEATRHPRALRIIDRIVRMSGRAGLAGALVLVALPRLDRRGMVPPGVRTFMSGLLEAAQGTGQAPGGPEEREPSPGEAEPNREAA